MEEKLLKINFSSSLIHDKSIALKLIDKYEKKTDDKILSELKLLITNGFALTTDDAEEKVAFLKKLIDIMATRKKSESVIKLLVEEGFCASFKYIFEGFFPIIISKRNTKIENRKILSIIYPLMNIIYSLTNYPVFSQSFTDEGLNESYMHCLSGNHFTDDIIIDNENRQKLTKSLLGTIVNVLLVSNNEDSKFRLTKSQGIEVCERYDKSVIPIIAFFSHTIRTFLFSESQLLDSDISQIEFAINVLNASLEKRGIELFLFTAEEAIKIVNRIALSDINKLKFINAKVLESFFAIFKNVYKVDDNVIKLALKGLQMFISNHSTEILAYPCALEILKNLLQNKNDIIKIEVNIALSKLRDKNERLDSNFVITKDFVAKKRDKIETFKIENSKYQKDQSFNLIELREEDKYSYEETQIKPLGENRKDNLIFVMNNAHEKPINNWNVENVSDWLKSKNLLHLNRHFNLFNGAMLLECAKKKKVPTATLR